MGAKDQQIGGSHYSKYKIQPAEFAMANDLNYCQCLMLRYMMRYRDKDGLQDLRKLIHVAELAIELEYATSADKCSGCAA